MSTTAHEAPGAAALPTASDQLRERLDDPAVAASLNVVLDNVASLAFIAEALDGFLTRGDTIMDTVAGGVHDMRPLLDSLQSLRGPVAELQATGPQLLDAGRALIASDMLSPTVLAVLGKLAQSLVQGSEAATRNQTSVGGVFPALRALRDPDVAKGLGFLVEVARALGKNL